MEPLEKTAYLSVLVNLLLVGIKTGLAAISGSLALKADVVHSLCDVVASAVVLVGIKISKRPARGFPYGLYKVENLVSLGMSFLIVLAGYNILTEATWGAPKVLPSHIPIAAAGVVLTIAITGIFSRYELQKGRETASPSLMADARHIRTDMLSSLAVLASLLGSAAGWALDRYAALIVVAFIARAAFSVFLDAVRVLLDASLDFSSLNRIREITLGDSRVVAINDLRARNAGRFKFVELDITLRVKEFEKGHRVSEEIKQRIRNDLENVDHVQIHYQPSPRDRLIVGIPLCNDLKTVSEHFGEAPFFKVLTLQSGHREFTKDTILRNPHLAEEKAKGIKVAQWLLEQRLDRMVVYTDLAGRGPGFVFGNAEVEVLVVKERAAEAALSLGIADWEGSHVSGKLRIEG